MIRIIINGIGGIIICLVIIGVWFYFGYDLGKGNGDLK